MTTGTHRKAASLPRIPWGFVIAGAILAIAAGLLLAAVSWLGTPTYAGGNVLQPAVTAAKHIHPRPARPFWDGQHPKVWTSDREPMCDWRYTYHWGIIIDPRTQEHYFALCEPEGPARPGHDQVWSWSIVAPQ